MRKFWLGAIGLLVMAILAVPGYGRESHFYHGDGGYSASFNLIGGQYTVYVSAHFVQNYKTHSPDSCVFVGNLQRVWPTHESSQLGGPAPIRNPIWFKLGPKPVALAAGHYALYIASTSDCEWKFILASSPQNATGIAEPRMFKAGAMGTSASDTASLKDTVQFTAQYRTAKDAALPVSGEMQIVHDGQLVRTFPVKFGIDDAMQASIASVELRWQDSDAKYAGKNTARMVLKIGGQEYTTSTDFLLTP
ncbi:MAG: hypothetical protein WBD10_05450 [Acidobacteriaceae bacterium]